MKALKYALICAVLSTLVAALQLFPFFMGLDIDSPDMTLYWNVIRRDFFASHSLWYDKILNGSSILANPHYGVFYLFNFVYRIFPDALALRIYFLLHYAILGGGAGIWASLHGERLSRAMIAAILLMASGIIASTPFRSIPNLTSVCWLPWIACLGVHANRQRSLLPIGLAGGLTGIGISSGDIQMLAYGPLATLAGSVSSLLESDLDLADELNRRNRISQCGRPLQASLLFVIGMLVTSGVNLFYGFQTWLMSPRSQGLSAEEALAYSFHPIRIVEFFWQVFGQDGTLEFTGQRFTSSLYGHTWWYPNVGFGPSAAIVLLIGLRNTYKNRAYWGYSCLAAGMLGWSFGRWNPVVRWIVEHSVLLRSIRYPAKCLLPACIISLPIIWRGIDGILSFIELRPSFRRSTVVFLVLTALLVPPLTQELGFDYLPKGWNQAFPWMEKLAAVPRDASPARLVVDPRMPITSPSESALVQAGPIAWGVRSFLSPEATTKPIDQSYLTIDDFAKATVRDNFNFNFLITGSILSPALQTACDQGTLICHVAGHRDHLTLLYPAKWPQRWALVPSWKRGEVEDLIASKETPPDLSPMGLYVSRLRFLNEFGLIATDSRSSLFDSSRAQGPCGSVEASQFNQEYSSARFRISSQCQNLLAVNLRFVAGWRAKIDGVPAPIGEVNGRMLGIVVPPGHHDVELHYAPIGTSALPVMTFAQWLTCLLVIVTIAQRGATPKEVVTSVYCDSRLRTKV